MEGKGILFKKFADIDVFDIEVNAKNPDDVIRCVRDARAHLRRHQPRGHQGARVLLHRGGAQEALKIPVFHDDQHGTAIISAAAFLNALELVGKNIEKVRVVFCGAGAAGNRVREPVPERSA